MAFFDKLNDLAKNIGDKTKDAIDIGKLNTKINSEKSAISEAQKKIGEYYYTKYSSGEQIDSEMLEFCTAIDEHKRVIMESQAEIEKIKAAGEAAKAATVSSVPQAATEGIKCSACGVLNPTGTKFCKDCGNKMAQPEPANKFCPQCGASNVPGTKFCSECGTKLE